MATATQYMKTLSREGSQQLDPEVFRRLYTYMLKCRIVEERIRVLYRQGRFAENYFAAVGQEATEVDTIIELLPEDTVAPSHRNFVTNIMKGTPLTLLFAHIYGRETSPDQGLSAPAHCGYAPLNVITPSSPNRRSTAWILSFCESPRPIFLCFLRQRNWKTFARYPWRRSLPQWNARWIT